MCSLCLIDKFFSAVVRATVVGSSVVALVPGSLCKRGCPSRSCPVVSAPSVCAGVVIWCSGVLVVLVGPPLSAGGGPWASVQ